MATPAPRPLTITQRRQRRERVARIAKDLGFVGFVEYRHVYSQTGGAQYGRGANAANDLLTVYAEAFDRDANPEDFSLAAMIAHERGHQILARHPRIATRVTGKISAESEEILASLLGAMICLDENDRSNLYAKATTELLDRGQPKDAVTQRLQELWKLLEVLL